MIINVFNIWRIYSGALLKKMPERYIISDRPCVLISVC